MSTTHKATPYAREYMAGGELFLASDYALSYSLGLEIAESLGESLADPHTAELDEIVYETVEACLPAYYSQILEEWREAGCPDPEVTDFDASTGPVIWQLMTRALYDAMREFAWGVVGEAETPEEALNRLNSIYPYKTN